MKKEENHKRIPELKKKALEVSVKEGAAASVSSGIGQTYITPFALALNANPLHIGILSSFSGLIDPIAQIFGSNLMRTQTRKKIVSKVVLIQSLLWLPLALIGFLFWKGILQGFSIYALIISYILLTITTGLYYPAWFSWMGDIVPEEERGRFFGRRNKITSIVGLAAGLIAAFVLDAFKTKGLALIGFAILFLTASIFRILSYAILKKQYSPPLRVKKSSYFSFMNFLKRYDNFGKFAVYSGMLYFSIMIASPFFAVYMLEHLNFSYITFMIVTASSTIFYLISLPLVGKFSDRFGNIKLLYISNLMFFLNPLMWIFIKSPILLILIPQLITGISNSTLIIASTDFAYDSVSPQKRGVCISYLNLLIGLGIFAGSLVGGALVKYSGISAVFPFFLVFGISAVCRLLSGILFLPKIKDERKFENLPPQPHHISILHPFRAVHAETTWLKAVFR